jgi:type VI secretion system secreted protein Hcp
MKRTRVSAALVLTAGLAFAPVARAAVDAFIWFEGIAGESKDPQHMGWLEASSWQLDQIRTSTSRVHRATGGPTKLIFQAISITKNIDKASPTLRLFCANGKHIPNATISLRKGGGTQEYLVLKLRDVSMASYHASAGGAGATETFVLSAADATMDYPPAPTPKPIPAAVAPMPAGAVRK